MRSCGSPCSPRQERLRLEAANHELETADGGSQTHGGGALEGSLLADGSLNLTEAAKALQQQPKKFNQHLYCSLRWIYKRVPVASSGLVIRTRCSRDC